MHGDRSDFGYFRSIKHNTREHIEIQWRLNSVSVLLCRKMCRFIWLVCLNQFQDCHKFPSCWFFEAFLYTLDIETYVRCCHVSRTHNWAAPLEMRNRNKIELYAWNWRTNRFGKRDSVVSFFSISISLAVKWFNSQL